MKIFKQALELQHAQDKLDLVKREIFEKIKDFLLLKSLEGKYILSDPYQIKNYTIPWFAFFLNRINLKFRSESC